jgi:hypothetical protein
MTPQYCSHTQFPFLEQVVQQEPFTRPWLASIEDVRLAQEEIEGRIPLYYLIALGTCSGGMRNENICMVTRTVLIPYNGPDGLGDI